VREREVAALIAHGKSNREIAEVLVVTERTIESHASNIMFKLGVHFSTLSANRQISRTPRSISASEAAREIRT